MSSSFLWSTKLFGLRKDSTQRQYQNHDIEIVLIPTFFKKLSTLSSTLPSTRYPITAAIQPSTHTSSVLWQGGVMENKWALGRTRWSDVMMRREAFKCEA
jgi:hypothetical protein